MLNVQRSAPALRPGKSTGDRSPDNSSAAQFQSLDVVLTPTPIDLQAEAGVLRGGDSRCASVRTCQQRSPDVRGVTGDGPWELD